MTASFQGFAPPKTSGFFANLLTCWVVPICGCPAAVTVSAWETERLDEC